MEKNPFKNVDPVLVDIKDPQVDYAWSVRHGVINLRKATLSRYHGGGRVRFFARGIAFFVAFAFFALVAHTSYIVYKTKDEVGKTGFRVAENIRSSVLSLQSFDATNAKTGFKENILEIQKLESSLEENGLSKMASALGGIIPAFKSVGVLLQNTASLNTSFFTLADSLDTLQRNGFLYFQSDGPKLIKTLESTRNAISTIVSSAESIKNATNNLKSFSNSARLMDKDIAEMYLSHSAELYRVETFLDSFISLINSEEEKHILLMFQNPAEIRPAGGFLGSYADVGVTRGQMTTLDVRDIYDPDGQMFEKIVPPKELQTITEAWGARDANWFFDFPASAENVSWFLEHSKIYSEKNVTFDMVVSINIPVVESILELSGPIALPEYNLVISKDNFLTEVQREVEAGKDKKTNGQPKTILKKLAPILIEQMKTLSDDQKEKLITAFGDHIEKKDIMFYAKDPSIQSFFHTYGVDGSVTSFPNNFWGSYVAVVNTNVAGGKTDAFIDQTIDATVHIDTSGSLLTDLSVTRTHTGGDKKDPWWNVENKNYIQILTNPGSSLVSLSGNSTKKERSIFDYGANKFEYRDALQKIEKSKVLLTEWNAWMFNAFDKTGFGTWFFVPAKKSKTVSFRYHTDNEVGVDIKDGTIYTFFYDRQSGVPTSLSVVVNAPIGFVWKETNNPVLSFDVEETKGVESFSGELIHTSASN
ncbi:DUF4012 domain-containing protein [Candidatus Parcubacteria bacterium]|jgi:hypothetical protein|nr:MAG: DUF4012 domain-containing protein [Candidatus Parcubacteria bacterium]